MTILNVGQLVNRHTDVTAELQAAFNVCRDTGGGIVEFASGEYQTGSVRIYSNTTVLLRSGAVIKGSPDLDAYQTFGQQTSIKYLQSAYFTQLWHLPANYFRAIFAAYQAENIMIEAEPGAIIDGQSLTDPNGEEGFRGPMGLLFSHVDQLRLTGYQFQNGANWAHVIESCTHVEVHNVAVIGGHDGFNLHHSTDVLIRDCRLETGDDCFAGYDLDGLTIQHCNLNTACNGTRLSGRQIVINDCNLIGPGKYPHQSEGTYYTHALLKYYSLAIDVNRTSESELAFNSLTIENLRRVVMYQNGDRQLLQDGTALTKLVFNNVEMKAIAETSYCQGNGVKMELRFENCSITFDQEMPFIIIDDAVRLVIKNCNFTVPTTIVTSSGKVVAVRGQTSLAM